MPWLLLSVIGTAVWLWVVQQWHLGPAAAIALSLGLAVVMVVLSLWFDGGRRD